VGSWQLTPGTSSIQPIHQLASCFTTAVNVCFIFLPPILGSIPNRVLSSSALLSGVNHRGNAIPQGRIASRTRFG